ncbi:MAG: PspC domain-containing protein [Culicoidibacterales bacterium]
MDTTLYRSKKDRVITGVCGGIAEYFGFNTLTLRILFVLFCGFTLWLYISLAILMPEKNIYY